MEWFKNPCHVDGINKSILTSKRTKEQINQFFKIKLVNQLGRARRYPTLYEKERNGTENYYYHLGFIRTALAPQLH